MLTKVRVLRPEKEALSSQSFARIEMKYFLNDEQYEAWKHVLRSHMTLDEYGLSAIHSIYFDTDDYAMIRHSLEKPAYKEKLRLRGYGRVTENSPVYVEIKKKYDGIVYKRRQEATLPQAREWLLGSGRMPADTQIAREITYLADFYRPSPKIYIGYDREAYFGREDPALRLTLDSNLRFRTDHLDLAQGGGGQRMLDEPLHLMEVKIPGAIPLWMLRAMEELSIRPTSFSKYGYCYVNFIRNKRPEIIPFQEAQVC